MPQANPALRAATPLQIFLPGLHTAMSGQAIAFTESDLAATAAAYNPAQHEAPLVVGHPRHDLPAYGWVESLRFSEGGLDATPAQVNPDFADMVAAGAFKKISASFYAPDAPQNPVPGIYYLRHVGFLGAQPPAIKGMRHPSFSDTEEGVLTFGELDAPLTPPVFPSPPPEPAVTLEEKTALEAENARLKTELAANKTAQLHAANVAFCDGLPGVLPAWREVAVATLDHLAAQSAPVEFGEGETKAPLLEKFKAMLAAQPAPVQFGESATHQRAAQADKTVEFAAPAGYSVDPLAMGLHAKAQAHMKANDCSYIEAVKAVA